MRRSFAIATVIGALVLAGCGGSSSRSTTTTATAPPSTTTPAGPTATLVAAGDIATCTNDNDTKTAALVAARPNAAVALLGDNVYENGTAKEFANCFGPTWGAFNDRAHPAPGNHEYNTKGAAPYYAYFGAAAGPSGQGWYSYDLGAWHVIALNSNCEKIGGCGADSAQAQWLRADLAAHPARCTLAYFHHPRFSSGPHGSTSSMDPLWRILADARADVVLSGHDHDYERFAPKDGEGRGNADGVRQFVVGTGGRELYPILLTRSGSEAHNSDTYGVLELTLKPAGYDWRFVPVAGASYTDAGSSTCSS